MPFCNAFFYLFSFIKKFKGLLQSVNCYLILKIKICKTHKSVQKRSKPCHFSTQLFPLYSLYILPKKRVTRNVTIVFPKNFPIHFHSKMIHTDWLSAVILHNKILFFLGRKEDVILARLASILIREHEIELNYLRRKTTDVMIYETQIEIIRLYR